MLTAVCVRLSADGRVHSARCGGSAHTLCGCMACHEQGWERVGGEGHPVQCCPAASKFIWKQGSDTIV